MTPSGLGGGGRQPESDDGEPGDTGPGTGADPAGRAGQDGPTSLVDALRGPLGDGDLQAAQALALSALGGGLPLIDLYDTVIRPILDDVGAQWQGGQLSVGQEHVYSATVRALIERLGGQPTPSVNRGRAVLIAAPGEQHVLGLLMLRHVLRNRGWRVGMPDPLPLRDLVDLVRTLGDVTVLGVSLHACPKPPVVRKWIGSCRELLPGIPVVLGGLAVRRDPDLWRRVGAAGGAVDLRGALALLEGLTNPLTPKEREILTLASHGATNDEISRLLRVKASTVKTHLERIYLKLGTRDRAASVALGLRRGWIE